MLERGSKVLLVLLFALLLIISQTGCDKKNPEPSQAGDEAGDETAGGSSANGAANDENSASGEAGDESSAGSEGIAGGEGEAKIFESPVSKEGFYLDTICRITIYALAGGDDPETIIDDAFKQCELYEGELSKTIETSDIYKLNHAGGEPVTCGEHAINCLADGMNFAFYSEGKFNIAIGALTELWDFHSPDPKVPEEADIEKALEAVYEMSLSVTDEPIDFVGGEDVALIDPNIRVDLGGIAKGYIADRVSEFLLSRGVTGGVVDFGGNIEIIGYKDGQPGAGEVTGTSDITVGIKKPYTTTGELVGSIPLHNASVVTSGVYERYFEVDGVKYHHVLDPETGYPTDSGLDSVTVVGSMGRSEDCDALATIVLMEGADWLKAKLDEEAKMSEMERLTRFIALSDFAFVLIDKDGNIETLGNPSYTFSPIQ